MAATIEFIILVIGGIFAFTGVFSTKQSDRRNESDKVADGLIERLTKTVNQNVDDMKAMTIRIDDQQKEIHILQGKNEAYLQIINLRDPGVAKVFEAAPEIQQIIRDIKQLALDQSEALTNLTNAIETFINNLPPLTATMRA